MDLHLSGKIAVVTGASKGIGLAVTKALVDAGVHVVAGSRTRGEHLTALEEAGQVSFVSVDLSLPGAAEELVAVAAVRGGIDILINNVGGATVRPGGIASITDDDWRASWDFNLMSFARSARPFAISGNRWKSRPVAAIPVRLSTSCCNQSKSRRSSRRSRSTARWWMSCWPN